MYVDVEKVSENFETITYKFYTGTSNKDGLFIIHKSKLDPFEFDSCELINEIDDFASTALYQRAIVAVYKEYKKFHSFPQKAYFASG